MSLSVLVESPTLSFWRLFVERPCGRGLNRVSSPVHGKAVVGVVSLCRKRVVHLVLRCDRVRSVLKCVGCSEEAPVAFRTAASLFDRRCASFSWRLAFARTTRFVTILWVHLLVPSLLLVGEFPPTLLLVLRFLLPLVADDLGDVWVGQAGVFLCNFGVMGYAIQDEC